MSTIENLKDKDPFAEADDDSGEKVHKSQDYIHIRIQQRNGRKTLTTVQGLNNQKFNFDLIIKHFKKKFACNGTIVPESVEDKNAELDAKLDKKSDDEAEKKEAKKTDKKDTKKKKSTHKEVIQLQGDQRKNVYEFLTSKEFLNMDPKTIKVHGF